MSPSPFNFTVLVKFSLFENIQFFHLLKYGRFKEVRNSTNLPVSPAYLWLGFEFVQVTVPLHVHVYRHMQFLRVEEFQVTNL